MLSAHMELTVKQLMDELTYRLSKTRMYSIRQKWQCLEYPQPNKRLRVMEVAEVNVEPPSKKSRTWRHALPTYNFFWGGFTFARSLTLSTDLKVVSPQVKKASFVGRFLQDDEAYDVDGASDLRLCLEHVTTSTLEHHRNCLDGGFKYVLFSPLPGEMIQF